MSSCSVCREALPVLLGENAAGLSPAAITRLTKIWQTEYETWKKRSLAESDYIYVWVDGVHFNVRLEDERLCTLVMMGVRPDGNKEVIAIEDGYRESADSWASLLRDVTKRGMRAPEVAVGDGALGFWAALRDVWPTTREQRCWVHKIANVLDKLPRSMQPKAKSMLHEAMNAPTQSGFQLSIDGPHKEGFRQPRYELWSRHHQEWPPNCRRPDSHSRRAYLQAVDWCTRRLGAMYPANYCQLRSTLQAP